MNVDLVLEGGGVKGIALVGAYSVLVEESYEVQRVAGTSAGAIVGSLIASNMPLDTMRDLMTTADYTKFQDEGLLDHFGPVGKAFSVLFEKGIYEGRYLLSWLDGILTGAGKRTFDTFRIDDPGTSLPPERQYRLVVMVSDVSRGRLVRLPWDYRSYGVDPGGALVAEAVRASMSIPFFYEPVRLEYRDDAGRLTTSYLVDGGMLSNFPIDVFDRTDGKRPRWPTFGIKLSARPDSVIEQRFDVEGPLGLAKAMVGTMMNFHDQMHIDDPCVEKRVIFVDTGSVKSTDFDLDEATQQMLYDNGRLAAEKFLSTWDFDEYVEECRTP
jgi:NTE family protein